MIFFQKPGVEGGGAPWEKETQKIILG